MLVQFIYMECDLKSCLFHCAITAGIVLFIYYILGVALYIYIVIITKKYYSADLERWRGNRLFLVGRGRGGR